jgi:hypothetical protein
MAAECSGIIYNLNAWIQTSELKALELLNIQFIYSIRDVYIAHFVNYSQLNNYDIFFELFSNYLPHLPSLSDLPSNNL